MANEYIYVGQEALEIRLDTNIDITGATDLKIKYRKPDGTEDEWDADLYGTTQISYDLQADAGELDQSGVWDFWTYATMADGRVIPGRHVQYYVHVEGK